MPTFGQGFPAYIVAEIGSNHDGDLERAKTLVVEAKKSGAPHAELLKAERDLKMSRYYEDSRELSKRLTIWRSSLRSVK